MTSYTQPEIFGQFASEMFDSLHFSTKCATQYELNSSVAMATYWVPVLPQPRAQGPLLLGPGGNEVDLSYIEGFLCHPFGVPF